MKKEKMKNGYEDVLKEMMKASLLQPSSEFTSRVMKMVQNANAPMQKVYKPLISFKGWIIILSSILILIASCLMVILNGNDTSSAYFDFLNPVINSINDINTSLDVGAVFIGLMVVASITILLLADFVFNTNINPETGFE